MSHHRTEPAQIQTSEGAPTPEGERANEPPLSLADRGSEESASARNQRRESPQTDRSVVERIVARLRQEAALMGANDDAEIYVYGPPNLHRAADIVAREFGGSESSSKGEP